MLLLEKEKQHCKSCFNLRITVSSLLPKFLKPKHTLERSFKSTLRRQTN